MKIVIIALSLVLTQIRGEVLQAVLGDWSQDPDRKYGIPYLMAEKKPIIRSVFILNKICNTTVSRRNYPFYNQ